MILIFNNCLILLLTIHSIQMGAIFVAAGKIDKVEDKALKISMSEEEGFELYQQWIDQVFTTLMSLMMQRKFNENYANSNRIAMETCFVTAKNVPAKARCFQKHNLKNIKQNDAKAKDKFRIKFRKIRQNGNHQQLLSPSIFSLHTEGTEMEKALSLPKLLQGLGIRDREEWLDFVMEMSGTNRAIPKKSNDRRLDDAFKRSILSKEKVKKLLGLFELQKVELWEQMVQSLDNKQNNALNADGFTTMRIDQLEMVYGRNSPYNDSRTLRRLKPIVEDGIDANKLIEADIQRIAEMQSFSLRKRDIVLSPAAFRPRINSPLFGSIVLSPNIFSPIVNSPLVLGSLILSPRLFTPLVLSPRLMFPLILSTCNFSPVILSPSVMIPFVLSPGMFDGVILSPYVMAPQILSPQLFLPVILSPLLMVPNILNPYVGIATVLSPSALNPSVYSPKFLGGLVLSPYAFSPSLHSPAYSYTVILSPSFLS